MVNKIKLIKSVMENYPEAGYGNALRCESYDYKNTKFKFLDTEDGKRYTVTLPKLLKGLKILLKVVENGHYFNCGVAPNLLSSGYDWDAQDADALVQCAIFGDVIYG